MTSHDEELHQHAAATHHDDHGHGHADLSHAHESPLIMLLPLVPLAIGAIFAGWYAENWFVGEGRVEFWRDALFVLPQDDSVGAAAADPLWEKLLPLALAVSGILLAYVFYLWRPGLPQKIASGLGAVYRMVFRKYYFDELYDRLFVHNALRFGSFFWHAGDDAVIDGLGPNGIARLAVRVGQSVSAMETGYIYHYAFVMVIGLAGFVTWFCLKGY